MAKSFSWKTTTLFSGLNGFNERANKAVGAALEYQATRSESYMKQNAKWQDDTGNARSGLFTATKHEGTRHYLLLSHGVDYGIWLELAFSGKYAIVLPAYLVATEEVRARLTRLFANIPGGK